LGNHLDLLSYRAPADPCGHVGKDDSHENAKSDVTVHIEAEDSEHVRGTVKSNVSASGNAMNVNGTFTSKWLGMVCGDTK
jgi:hypothetical protein